MRQTHKETTLFTLEIHLGNLQDLFIYYYYYLFIYYEVPSEFSSNVFSRLISYHYTLTHTHTHTHTP